MNILTINENSMESKNDITIYLHHSINVESFESKIKTIDSKIYLDRLRQSYKEYKKEGSRYSDLTNRFKDFYNAERLFCLDTCLLSFNDIEVMENEINNLF